MQKETNLLIVWIVVGMFILGAGLIIWLARPETQKTNLSQVNSEAGLAFEISENTFDFGEVSMSAGKVNHTFQIKNLRAEPVILERIYTSCMCTSAVLKKAGKNFGPFGMQGHGYIPKINQTFASGEQAELEVIFDPAAHGPAGIGYVERTVYLETSAGTQQVMIKAMVKP